MGKLVLVALQDFGGFLHALRAHGKGSFALALERVDGKLNFLFNFGLCERLKSLDHFSRGGINGCNGHDCDSSPDSLICVGMNGLGGWLYLHNTSAARMVKTIPP